MSAIAKTASITLITAVPGSGKTLRAVWYMREALEAGEQVWACNINGLKLDGVNEFPDPTKWEDLPAGSILVVDEAQKFFRAGREVPSYIAAMETIRHMGIRLILITQHPALIHGNIRALVGFHEHLVRENGKQSVTVYTRSRVIDNVRSDKALAAEDHASWTYPTDVFELYTSAEVHTVKRTIPSKYKRAALLFALAIALFAGVVWRIRSNLQADESTIAAAGLPQASQPAATGKAKDAGNGPAFKTAGDYAQAMMPLVPALPASAQAFNSREMLAQPEVYCMSSGKMVGNVWHVDSCTCLTEQGTRYDLDLQQCGQIARSGGVYNPYRAPIQDGNATRLDSGTGEGRSPSETASMRGISTEFGTMAAYGGLGVD